VRVTESQLEALAEDVADAEDEDARVGAVAEFIAAITPNGPVPSFLDPLIDKAEAEAYTRLYRGARKWVTKIFKRDPKKRAERRKKRRRKRKG
jgi:hypothetical protein